jgi:hypothetical protein
VEDAEGHARASPAAAVGSGTPDGEGRTGPLPLRALSPTSRSRRSDAGRDLLRPDAVAPLRYPATPRQAGRWPDGPALPHRLPRYGTATARTRSKSSLKGGPVSRRRAFERADVCLPRPKARAKRWSLRANGHRNSHCVPTPHYTRGLRQYRQGSQYSPKEAPRLRDAHERVLSVPIGVALRG